MDCTVHVTDHHVSVQQLKCSSHTFGQSLDCQGDLHLIVLKVNVAGCQACTQRQSNAVPGTVHELYVIPLGWPMSCLPFFTLLQVVSDQLDHIARVKIYVDVMVNTR